MFNCPAKMHCFPGTFVVFSCVSKYNLLLAFCLYFCCE